MNSVRTKTTQNFSGDCPGKPTLAQFLDGKSGEVSGHIDTCESCQRLLQELFELSAAGQDFQIWSERASNISGAEDTASREDEAFLETLVANLTSNVDSLISELFTEQRHRETIRFPGPADENAPLGRLGKYEMIELVGSGATGYLYRAWDPELQRFVAIKVLRSEYAAVDSARERFLREAHAAARIQHEQIAAVYEVNSPEDFPPWIVQELIHGESLQASLDRDGAFSPIQAARSASQILSALAAAHDCDIVHRDVKPSNVLIEHETGRLKLVDFGLARLTALKSDLTADGVIAGTPAYMSPEQILNPADVDDRADVYSAGVVLYELLTGERPFRGSVRRVLDNVLNVDVVSPRRLDDGIPRDLENICLKAMSRDATRRYASATDFQDDLHRFLNRQPVLARAVSRGERIARLAQRNPAIAALSSIMLLGLLTALIGWATFTVELSAANSDLADTVHSLKVTNANLREAEERAKLHGAVAEEQINVAFDMVSALIFEVQNELADQQGTEELRRRLLSRAIDGLDRVRGSAKESTSAAIGEIMAANRIGDALRDLDQPEAIQQYERAFDAANNLLQTTPNSAEHEIFCNALAVSAWNLGDAHRVAGNVETARGTYDAGLHAVKSWLQQNIESLDAKYNEALGLQRLADLARDSGDEMTYRELLERCHNSLIEVAERSSAEEISRTLARVKFGLWKSAGKDSRKAESIDSVYDLLNSIVENPVGSAPDPDFLNLKATVWIESARIQEDPKVVAKMTHEALVFLAAAPKTSRNLLAVARSMLAQSLIQQDKQQEAQQLFATWGEPELAWKNTSQAGYLLTRMLVEMLAGDFDKAEQTNQAVAGVFERASSDADVKILNEQRRQWAGLRSQLKTKSNQ